MTAWPVCFELLPERGINWRKRFPMRYITQREGEREQRVPAKRSRQAPLHVICDTTIHVFFSEHHLPSTPSSIPSQDASTYGQERVRLN